MQFGMETEMNSKINDSNGERSGERGAALATVLLVAFLILTASIALLSGVAAGTKNGTDMLSETKAFYAAESGLQATINALRHRDPKVKYSQAVANPSMSNYITYNYPLSTPDRVVIGQPAADYTPASGEAFVISVDDPDNYGDGLTFNTYDVQTKFTSYTGSGGGVITGSGAVSTVTITAPPPAPTPTPDPTPDPLPTPAPDSQLIITMNTSGPTNVPYSSGVPTNVQLASFSITTVEAGAVMPDGDVIEFQIIYSLTAPRAAKKAIYGKITKAAGLPPNVTFTSQTYELVGSTIELCSSSPTAPGCPDVTLQLTGAGPSNVYGYITPVEPIRLLVNSTGYGPNGAKKVLEAIIRKDIPNLSGSAAATTMIGPSTCPVGYPSCLPFDFAPGTSAGITYSGCSADGSGCVPSFGLTNPDNLNAVATAQRPNGDPISAQPPAANIAGQLPDWQQSVPALDAFVDEMRTLAQGSDRYFRSSNGTTPVGVPNNPGDFGTGTGITFCEGSCQVGGSGGGVLVVTGKLTNTGGFSFKGLILVVGEEGWLRNGGGDGQVIGNVVLAAYNIRNYIPENHATTFLPPRYSITGGGNSDVIYGDITSAFSNTSGVSDIVQAIAEK